MNKHLKEIIELSQFDKTLDAFIPQEALIRSKVSALEAEAKDAQNALNQCEETVKELGFKKAKHNTLIGELSDKVNDIEKKYTQIKNEKELKALQVEEEIAREQITFANEEIARFDKLVAREEEKKGELSQKIESLKGQILEAIANVKDELESLENKKNKAYEERTKICEGINQGILSFYQKVRRWAGNTAVVPVKKQACMGCYMIVNDKTYASVLQGEEIVTCPSCGRILYVEEVLA